MVKLNLTKEQRAHVLKLWSEHDEAVAKLTLEIAKLDAECVKKRMNVLTDAQWKKLRELDYERLDDRDKSKSKDKR